MRILVCLKQVPEKDSRYRLNSTGTSILEDDLAFETNESDLYALEEALRLREKHGGEVVILSLGAERVLKTIKNGLAMGADRAFHLNDAAFSSADAFVTAKAFARTIQAEGFDIVLTGVQSDDMAFGQTGPALAEFLQWPHVTMVVEVDVDAGGQSLRVKRELESGLFERIKVALPVLLTIQSGINHPRYPTLKGIMHAKSKPVQQISAESLRMAAAELGAEGAKVIHQRLFFPERKKQTVMLEGAPDEVVRNLLERLQKEAKVL
jgi:electron transfer flavoprotein beta subunit